MSHTHQRQQRHFTRSHQSVHAISRSRNVATQPAAQMPHNCHVACSRAIPAHLDADSLLRIAAVVARRLCQQLILSPLRGQDDACVGGLAPRVLVGSVQGVELAEAVVGGQVHHPEDILVDIALALQEARGKDVVETRNLASWGVAGCVA